MRKVEAHESIARFQACHENSHIGLCAGVRLHIGILGIEKLADPVNGQLLDLVHHFATAIITCLRITFGILVRADRSQSRKDLVGNEIFRSDKLQTIALTLLLFLNQIQNLNILFHI